MTLTHGRQAARDAGRVSPASDGRRLPGGAVAVAASVPSPEGGAPANWHRRDASRHVATQRNYPSVTAMPSTQDTPGAKRGGSSGGCADLAGRGAWRPTPRRRDLLGISLQGRGARKARLAARRSSSTRRCQLALFWSSCASRRVTSPTIAISMDW